MKKLLFLGIFLTTACSSNKLTEINLTYVKPPLNIPAIVSYRESMVVDALASEKIKVNYFEMTSGSQQTSAMAAGSIDISTVLGGTSAIIAAANGADIKIIGMFSRAPKAFALMAKTPMESLKGKKIGGPKGTVLHQLLLATLKKQNLTINDVEFISMGISEALNSVLKGDIDVALLAGASILIAQDQGIVTLQDGEGLVDGSTVIGVRGAFAKQHPNIIDTYLDVQKKSIQFLNENPEQAYTYVSEEVQLSTDQVKELVPLFNFDNKITDTDIQNLNATQEFLLETGLISNKINIQDMIYQK